MLSDSPPDRDLEWTEAGIEGAWRFVNRLWRLVAEPAGPIAAGAGRSRRRPTPLARQPAAALALLRECHRTIARVTEDLDRFAFNRAVARMREFANLVGDYGER